jgi:hypothetical protein
MRTDREFLTGAEFSGKSTHFPETGFQKNPTFPSTKKYEKAISYLIHFE